MVALNLTRGKVENAFSRYARNERPLNEDGDEVNHPAKWWHVLGKNNVTYSVKPIASLASGVPIDTFNTTDARKQLARIGFVVFDARGTTMDEDIYNESIKLKRELSFAALCKKAASTPTTKPKKETVQVTRFSRNQYVVAAVLKRANGICEYCRNSAPFKRKNGKAKGEPYLEVHHIKQLAKNGDDTVKNAIALCPNCHRKTHYGNLTPVKLKNGLP